jgi:hypothetical protein
METQDILAQIDAEIGKLQQVRAILTGFATNGPTRNVSQSATKKRQLSSEARAKISAAQKARWANAKKAAK